jgi:predicted acyltransferase
MTSVEPTVTQGKRVVSVDIYRGMVMFLMLAEVLHLSELREHFKTFPEWFQRFWDGVVFHTTHVEWAGCSLHDMIQPSFTFLVGTSMAFSFTKRTAQGQAWSSMLWHALFRSLLLVFLGIFLRSLGRSQTNFTFDDTLTQIGLGYWILFLLAPLAPRWLFGALIILLVGYWGAFVVYPLPPADFAYEQVGVPAAWPEHYTGFASHWNKNSNLAWAFDRWWMNLFPRETPFEYSAGGYCTLSFLPTLGTMLFGLIAGKWLEMEQATTRRLLLLVATGLACVGIAWLLDAYGICPNVKRIWTPSWTLWSGGICFLWLAALHAVVDVAGWKGWGYFWTVIGANSIAAYVMSWTLEAPIHAALQRHFGWLVDATIADPYRPLVLGAITLALFWGILRWMYRRGILIRI